MSTRQTNTSCRLSVARSAITAAATRKRLETNRASWKPEVRSSGRGDVAGQQVIRARGRNRRDDGEAECGAELRRCVDRGGGEISLLSVARPRFTRLNLS
jgi:hypothetical protein